MGERKACNGPDYLRYFKTLSTATASRDLKRGVDQGLLKKSGERATTRYRSLGTSNIER